jgi:signal transduction histidine kinase
VLWPAGAALGLAAEAGAPVSGDMLADLATGWVVLGCGLALWGHRRRSGVLLAAAGAAWFAGNFTPWALFWHRGPLVHVVLSWPAGRLVSAGVGAGYVAAVVQPVWASEPATLALAAALAAACARRRDVTRPAGLTLALALAAGAVARLLYPAGDADRAALLAYELVLCGVATGLASAGRRPLTDLVVELGERRSGEDPARALGDPALAGDPRLREAIAAASRLTDANASLQAAVRAQVEELEASRRRLLAAADDERRRLERRLRDGAGRRLDRIESLLARVGEGPAGRTREALAHARADLEELARGLHPARLDDYGLAAALAELARGGAVPVVLDVAAERLDPGAEAVVYYVCAEGLANVTKYAAATRVAITVTRGDHAVRVTVADDGTGGADPERGTGLRGLRDRVEAHGGRLDIDSSPGGGTRLSARIPL